MKKICFLIPDGVGIRNYLYSGVLNELEKQGIQVQIWHSLEEEVIPLSQKITGVYVESFQLKSFAEDAITQLIRESVAYARLKHNVRLTGNDTILSNWSFGKLTFKKRMLTKLAEWVGKSVKSYDSILALESLLWKKLRNSSPYQNSLLRLQEINPDLLFCTHQRVPSASVAILAAQDLGIPTATSIFSWDNIPKARLAVRPDHYLVWSDFMKNELRYFYPEISNEKITVTGTPQFDFYTNVNLIQDREVFALQHGLDASKHWILFSGDDIRTSPFDHEYLIDIAEALKNETDIQIIFRQVPVEGTERYTQVLQRFPQIHHINPYWKKGKFWQMFFPYPEDITHLVNLAFHCDTVINIGSTMALDFACFDKPGIYLKYDHHPDQTWSVNDTYRFQHFRSMEGLDPVGWIQSPQDIHSVVRAAVNTPHLVGKDRKDWLKIIIQPDPCQSSASKISEVLMKLILGNPITSK